MAIVRAHDVAQGLRLLADSLDREPEAMVPTVEVDFNCKYVYRTEDAKSMFLALAKLLPHPLTKGVQAYDKDALEIRFAHDAMIVTAEIKCSSVCKIIEPERIIPAVYDCTPLLSDEEEASLV